MKKTQIAIALAATLLASAPPARAADDKPAYPPFGFDLTARDKSVKPGNDFFQYANGRYLARTTIPADDSVASRRSGMSREIEGRLHAIVDELSKNAPEHPTDIHGKVGAFYSAFMDEARIEQVGVRAIEPELQAIRSAPDLAALARLMGRSSVDFYPTPFNVVIDVDLKRPSVYSLYINQAELGLPDVDYYTKPEYATQRAAYGAYASTLLKLMAWPDADAAAGEILALETRLAQAGWTKVQQRDVVAQYNPVTRAELQALAPTFPWQVFLEGSRLGDRDAFIAAQNTAFPKLAAVLADTPLTTLKAWMTFRSADAAAAYLPAAFTNASFELHGHVLAGQSEQQPRWKRGLIAVAGKGCDSDPHACFGTLQWAVGQVYAERWFPPATKAKVQDLVVNLKTAFRARMAALTWMGPATKAEALRKLDVVTIKVGYPDTWRDYADTPIRRDDLMADVRAAAASDWAFVVKRSSGPVDRSDWGMTPQTNNAYSGSLLDIVFPAGILQPPIFDAAADPAINYGAAGAVIGHELTHQFDDQGRTVDADGILRDWWEPADAAAFKARTDVLGAQYAAFEPLPGLHINPGLTMGENLADLGGVSIALDAYHASLHGKPAPVLGGLTGDQRVFLGWAQAWAGKSTPEAIRRLTTSDPHSFRKYRVNGVMRNIDAWYKAFGVKPGDALYVAPEKRVRVW
jgi:putative endopeptidase